MTARSDDSDDVSADQPDTQDDLERMKRAFTEVVSHELNTPVAIILGYTSMLRRHFEDSELDEVTGRALHGLEVAAERLESISDRIFKILSDQGRASTLQLADVDIASFLRTVHSHIRGFLDTRDQSLDIDIADDVPATLRADPDKLHDILVNLLMNAIKFSRDGQTIELRVRLSDNSSPPTLQIVVHDTGIGIEPDEIDQVFDAFFSTLQSRHHSSGEFEFGKRGIGLGLPIARQFARMHNGDILVESEPGEGSRFTVELPLSGGVDAPES
jgi:signal transduction histidine kinase